MTDQQFRETLDHLLCLPAGKASANAQEKIVAFLTSLPPSGPALEEKLKSIISAIFDEQRADAAPGAAAPGMVSSTVCKMLVSEIISRLAKQPPDLVLPIAEFFLEKSKFKALSYEEQVTNACQQLATIHEASGQYIKAAEALSKISLDGQVSYTAEDKMNLLVRIAQLFMAGGACEQADICVKRAYHFFPEIKNQAVINKYQACYAQILDFNKKFVEAAQRYSELSLKTTIAEPERVDALKRAVVCAALASVGQQRQRTLASLVKDERVQVMPVYPLLQSLFMERLLRRSDLEPLEALLLPHHLSQDVQIGGQSMSLASRAAIEHNLVAVSKIYQNITFDQLSIVLGDGMTAELAEAVVVEMISNGRLTGSIDQIDGLLYFEVRDVVAECDAQIQHLCMRLNNVVNKIAGLHPEFVAGVLSSSI